MPGIASAATAVVVGYLAAGTSTIRVGAGGIMLPNHSPLVIAEQFGTLESLYPGRIDLGLGARAGHRPAHGPRAAARPPSEARVPARRAGPAVPLRDRRSPGRRSGPCPAPASRCRSGSSARARSAPGSRPLLGLPYAFASHFAPTRPAGRARRSTGGEFRPSAQLAAPYAMAGLNVFAADTDDEARRLFTTPQQAFGEPLPRRSAARTRRRSTTSRRTGRRPRRRRRRRCSRDPSSARRRPCGRASSSSRELTGVDELMVVSAIYDHAARLRSYEILARRPGRCRPPRGRPAPAGLRLGGRTAARIGPSILVTNCHKDRVTRQPPGGVEGAWRQ